MPDPSESGSLPFDIRHQPDDATCGPTCLHAVYRYYGDDVPLGDLVRGVPALPEGGTLGVLLATDALGRGYRATVHTWNLLVFDPTWFAPDAEPLQTNLRRRADARRSDPKSRMATLAYLEFLERGGRIELCDLGPSLLGRLLERRTPILTGLSATFLYHEARQRPDDESDAIHGDPVGHFVVLTGYDPATREVVIADPMHPNPLSKTHIYAVPVERLIGAIFLGALTYDANLIVIEPRDYDAQLGR